MRESKPHPMDTFMSALGVGCLFVAGVIALCFVTSIVVGTIAFVRWAF